jgi:hypothetical protein
MTARGADGILFAPLRGQHVGQGFYGRLVDARRVALRPCETFLCIGVQGAEQGHASDRGGACEHLPPVYQSH